MKDCTDKAAKCDEIVTHTKVCKDKFAEMPSVDRVTPGDCFCMACGNPVAAWWNNGRIKVINY